MELSRVITVSDRSAAGLRPDLSGPALAELIRAAGYDVEIRLVADGSESVREALRAALDEGARLIVTTGGTGVGPRDRTPEATVAVIDRELPGIAEALRAEGRRHSPHAALSRGLAGVVDAQVTVLADYATNPSLNAWVPSLGEVAAVGFDGASAQEHRDNYRFNLTTDQGFVPDRLRAGDVLSVASAPLPQFAALTGDPAPGDGERQDDAGSAFLASTTQRLAAGDSEQWAQLGQAAQALRQGAWSDGTRAGEEQYLPGHGQYRLTRFVTEQQFVGSDEQYAATFALMASRLGYPARVVFGAEVPAGGEVRGKNVQAWVELSVQGHGWVTVPASVFTPDRSKKPDPNQQQNNKQESIQNVPPPNPVPPPGTYEEMTDTDPASARSELPVVDQFWRAFWGVVRWVGPPLGVLALIMGTILGSKALRARRRRTRGAPSTRIAGGWAEVLDAARDVGRPVPPSATRLEQSALLGRSDVTDLAVRANGAVFRGGEIDQQHVTEYWTEVRAARAAMVRDLPWWRRPLARLNLASLVTRRP